VTALGAQVATTEVVRFADGSIIELRPIGISDRRLISNFVAQLSPETTYRRFLSVGRGVRNQWVAKLINADQCDFLVYGAVASNEFGSTLVAVAESIRHPGAHERAEFALAAIDPWQNLGIGTLLTRHVARVARSSGIAQWETYGMADHPQMGKVMEHVGTRISFEIDHGLSHALYDLVDQSRSSHVSPARS
jgi:GNAT superfamily N-acetyltransferase